MSKTIYLPKSGGSTYAYTPGQSGSFEVSAAAFQSRICYAAAHVVCDPFAAGDPLTNPQIDWEATMAYRRHLWGLGFRVAEAMDTAQRGMGLKWKHAQELIRRSIAEAKTVGGELASGAGTDHLPPGPHVTLKQVIGAYEEQVGFVEQQGGRVILMASRALAACAKSAEDYDHVYGAILQQTSQPVILHWLGDMFDPALAGYWGSADVEQAMANCLAIIRRYAKHIDGIKISLLDAEKEVQMRRLLPEGVVMYTGDDFNYPELIAGDAQGYSHGLLGIFDAIAPAAACAIQALDQGDTSRYSQLLEKTVPLSRHIFQIPTYSYKTGIVFMAYLNGHQPHFRMIAGAESARSIVHLAELFVLADEAGLLRDPELATRRMEHVLALAGCYVAGSN